MVTFATAEEAIVALKDTFIELLGDDETFDPGTN